MHCSKQQPEQQQQQQQPTEELSNIHPDVVYAHIVPSKEPVTPDMGNSNSNDTPNEHEVNESVIYSELKNNDNDNHTAAPSGDLYAEVQKRYSLYPPP